DTDGGLDVCQAGLNWLVGQYFANEDLLGDFSARIDGAIDFLSQGEANLPAGIPDNDFSARWLGTLVPNESGLWRLGAFHDDGVRIWLDGEQIVNYWGPSPGTETLAELELEAGRGYHLRVEYVQYTGEAKLQLLWQAPSASEVAVVPTAALRPTFDRNGDGVPDLCADTDCDGDYLPDGYQIELDASADCNGNLVLDACEEGGDCDGDGIVDACGAVVPHGLVAEYFDSSDNGRLTERLASAIVPNIDFEFDGGSPNGVDGLGNDEYGIRFTGILTAPVSGTYQFIVDADDGVRLWIGDEVVIEHWENGNGTYTSSIELEAAWSYAFRLEWFEGIGGARVILRWAPPGGSPEVVPTEAFRPVLDLDANGVPDACDVDCDGDGVSDAVAIAEGLAEDCNANGVPDSCDVAAAPATETIAYWRFENAKAIGTDSGPLGLAASNTGASSQTAVPLATIPSTGEANTRSALLGNAGRLVVDDPLQHLAFFGEAFTVEAWVQLDQLAGTGSAGNRQWLACKKGATPDSQIDWGVLVQGAEYASTCDEVSGRTANFNGRELVFTGGYGDGGGTNKWAVVSNLRIVDNDWNYVAISFDPFNRICRFVLNDVYEEVSIESMQLFANDVPLVIGGHPNATGGINQLLRGSIDELRISRGVLPLTSLLASPYAPASADTNGDGVPDECGTPCVGDVNGDGVVNGVDLGTVLAGWGAAGGGTVSDLNSDGVVDGVDLGLVLAAWGGC
ncbi:MAG: PA14 domain-containing protein, partial [Phycisphaerales bacterium]